MAHFEQTCGNDKSDEIKANEDVEDVAVTARHLFDPCGEERCKQSCHCPRRQDMTVYRAQCLDAEYVAQVRRHCREAAAIARHDKINETCEDDLLFCHRQRIEADDLDEEEEYVCERSADVVGE